MKHQQPNPEDTLTEQEATTDNKHIIITQKAFNRLKEYNTTTPTGIIPGKRWKTDLNARALSHGIDSNWVIRGYEQAPNGKYTIKQWQILEITP